MTLDQKVLQATKENVNDVIYYTLKFESFFTEGIKGILGEQGNNGTQVSI